MIKVRPPRKSKLYAAPAVAIAARKTDNEWCDADRTSRVILTAKTSPPATLLVWAARRFARNVTTPATTASRASAAPFTNVAGANEVSCNLRAERQYDGAERIAGRYSNRRDGKRPAHAFGDTDAAGPRR